MTTDINLADAKPVNSEPTKKDVIRASEYAMFGVLIATFDLNMHVFKDMQQNPDKKEVDQSIVDFYEKKLFNACVEYVSAYETEKALGSQEEVASDG